MTVTIGRRELLAALGGAAAAWPLAARAQQPAISLNRPGGNITGMSMFSAELGAKSVELLRELVPRLPRLRIS
jgi:hypothetical protein